jgi:competence protein ComEA
VAGSAIYVHILGQVKQPGLYALRDGARAVDIVAAAGGFTAQADPAAINLARFLSDGEQIIVPAVGDAPAAAGGAALSADGKVNLNTADEAALETLPRIGPAMAQRILDWRQKNGRFSAVEDLLDITGIGDATFEGLRDLVTV